VIEFLRTTGNDEAQLIKLGSFKRQRMIIAAQF
jgi:hypothetical protein